MSAREQNSIYRSFYTACLDIQGKRSVVVGGGTVARRKIVSLIEAGSNVCVVSPVLESVLEYLAFQKEIEWKQREFKPGDLDGAFIVIAATDQPDVNRQIAALCREKGILCNAVDHPEAGSFIVPSTIERGPLTIAISTAGISPTIASMIRQEMEEAYGEEYGIFLELMATFRPIVQEEFSSPGIRQKIFERMVSSNALSLLREGEREQAQKELEDILYKAVQNPPVESEKSTSAS